MGLDLPYRGQRSPERGAVLHWLPLHFQTLPSCTRCDHRCAGWLPYYASTDDTLPSSIFGGIINGTVMAVRPREHATSGGSFPL